MPEYFFPAPAPSDSYIPVASSPSPSTTSDESSQCSSPVSLPSDEETVTTPTCKCKKKICVKTFPAFVIEKQNKFDLTLYLMFYVLDHNNVSSGKQTIHLWEFLKELLLQPDNYSGCIKWVSRSDGIFKIEDSSRVARLWGKRKNRPAMNYDKLSRSIRQYYKKGIIKKTEHSKRLVYQFCQPYLWKKEQNQRLINHDGHLPQDVPVTFRTWFLRHKLLLGIKSNFC